MKKLPIHEYFYTWQGEGTHTGRSAFFIRTYGCPVHCPWCDSAGTWHPDFKPDFVARLDVDELVALAVAASPALVVVTGGEPAIHDLRDLTAAMHAVGLPVHLETSGAFPIQGSFDWVTVSPKRWKPPLDEVLAMASEFKVIVENATTIEEWWQVLKPHWRGQPVWLNPEWSQSANREVLNAISDYVKLHGDPFRAGWQLHKLYNVDALDARSAPPVPLGGRI
ncbi:MAG: 7-carboxy-7-deazaguanine synthase QueE [Verrucomicrobia bacterium]|nr:7-carboxy-7-deazaguanine synthase QueE [Verrucomicrobiota bacterium]